MFTRETRMILSHVLPRNIATLQGPSLKIIAMMISRMDDVLKWGPRGFLM